jgi:hypothetical protein
VITLDTHVWVWWVDASPRRGSTAAHGMSFRQCLLTHLPMRRPHCLYRAEPDRSERNPAGRITATVRRLGGTMTRSVAVVYDGEVLRPVEPVDLPPNTRGRVTIGDPGEETPPAAPPRSVRRILDRARALDLPADLAAQHDHYLYGTPKR